MNDGTPPTRVIPPAAPGDPFWKHLLRERSVARWGNFNWFSARTLLMSLNDQVAKMIESGQPGSIVDRRRMRWVAEQRDRGVRYEVPIRLHDTTGMLFLGDPGEMDASQYVLVRDLGLVANGLRGRGVDTALLMSDVVYPAGDINQWADAVYLPYFGLPENAWAEAAVKYAEAHPGSTPPLPGPLRDWHVLAMPGNHDWYDGLNGFMFHACGTEPLAEVSYDEAGLTRRQRLAKYSWRAPSAPERERVTPLRAEAARYVPRALHLSREALDMADGVVAYAEAVDQAAVAPASAQTTSMPNLPGPYYAVDLGTHPTRTVEMSAPNGMRYHQAAPVVRVLVVDTGITGTVDPEQAAWLEKGLATPDLPKVVVTGIPLLVNNTSHPFPVSEPEDPLADPEATHDGAVDRRGGQLGGGDGRGRHPQLPADGRARAHRHECGRGRRPGREQHPAGHAVPQRADRRRRRGCVHVPDAQREVRRHRPAVEHERGRRGHRGAERGAQAVSRPGGVGARLRPAAARRLPAHPGGPRDRGPAGPGVAGARAGDVVRPGCERVRRATVARGGSDPGLVHGVGLGHAAGGRAAGGARVGGRPCRSKATGEHPEHPAVARHPGAADCRRGHRVPSRLGPGGRGADRPRSRGGAAAGAGALPGATAPELPEAAAEPGLPAARRRGGVADHPLQPRVGDRADPGRRGSGGSGGRRTQPVPQVAALGRAERCTARRWWRWASSRSQRSCW